MIQFLYGPFREHLELRSGKDRLAFDGVRVPVAREEFEPHIRQYLAISDNRDKLLRALARDRLGVITPPDEQGLCHWITRELELGTLVLVRCRRPALGPLGGIEEAEPTEPVIEKHEKEEEKLQEWKLECKHHAAGKRPFFDRGTRIQVVPDMGKTKDTITVHWRDDYRPELPDALTVRTTGRPETRATKGGQSGGYTAYTGEVEYRGALHEMRFPFSPFWRALNETTTYTIEPGPRSIGVEVFNPRQFEIELKFPPLEKFKAGYKYSSSSSAIEGKSLGELSLVKKQTVKREFKASAQSWEPSSRKVSSVEASGSLKTVDSSTQSSVEVNLKAKAEQKSKFVDAIVIKRDRGALKINVLEILGGILKFVESVLKLVDTIKEYAPQVGWYFDLNLQVMQGGLGAEWYWKEWEDHRVFRYIDIKASLDLFALTFEIGIGVSAYSFKAQAFAQFSGSFGAEISGKKYKPDGLPGFSGNADRTFSVAVGARVEAGHVLKLKATMESALEVDFEIGINMPNRSHVFSIDGGIVWTGIQCKAEGSIGAFGIAGTKVWKGTLIPKSERMKFQWPSEEEYKPPFLSRNAIKAILVKVLSNGWDVRVFTTSGKTFVPDEQWSLDRITSKLADRIERDTAFHRTPQMVDALANAIRQDLDALGTRWGRDWIEASRFERYVDDAVDGYSLAKHLKQGASPLQTLTG
ncbi:hypothetical protein [Chondromyces crocatus]|uniref:Uncharacterized protein n=1 Tax=Chondromyces crocatus TaxID=52 RepID=A0A0K1EFZ8_CHOCO|nr:hypothetical protein [Chondromyces crocatus]AKT39796.1 uncharacterized protein CMC5_039470 [Chondromyces crocatus]